MFFYFLTFQESKWVLKRCVTWGKVDISLALGCALHAARKSDVASVADIGGIYVPFITEETSGSSPCHPKSCIKSSLRSWLFPISVRWCYFHSLVRKNSLYYVNLCTHVLNHWSFLLPYKCFLLLFSFPCGVYFCIAAWRLLCCSYFAKNCSCDISFFFSRQRRLGSIF